MVVGRGFVNGEETAAEIVLGSSLWQRRFNSDPAIAGKTITLSGRLFTVIGVAPATFHSVDQILNTQFWVPVSYTHLDVYKRQRMALGAQPAHVLRMVVRQGLVLTIAGIVAGGALAIALGRAVASLSLIHI